jgi:hypothetical protein
MKASRPILLCKRNLLQTLADRRYIAKVSDESGDDEVHVQPFPNGGNTTTVSTRGGDQPRYSGDGTELFYVEGSTLVAVSVSTGPRFSAGPSKRLFEHVTLGRGLVSQYDVSADGRRLFSPNLRGRKLARRVPRPRAELSHKKQTT